MNVGVVLVGFCFWLIMGEGVLMLGDRELVFGWMVGGELWFVFVLGFFLVGGVWSLFCVRSGLFRYFGLLVGDLWVLNEKGGCVVVGVVGVVMFFVVVWFCVCFNVCVCFFRLVWFRGVGVCVGCWVGVLLFVWF